MTLKGMMNADKYEDFVEGCQLSVTPAGLCCARTCVTVETDN